MSNIPKIIHQTWKDDQVPERFKAYQKTWKTYLPEWEYRLWTDVDCRNFIANDYAWFLSIYDGYRKDIMRVDAVRYFWMHHFGGLYVDLDFEALKSIMPLLQGQTTVIGLEPEDHLQREMSKQFGLNKILCNAIMASEQNAPFWAFVIKQMEQNRNEENPLVATGPFFLTKCYNAYKNKSEITLIPSNLLYPTVEGEDNHTIEDAYAIHHWEGSWWRHLVKKPTKIDLMVNWFNEHFPKIYKRLGGFLKKE